MKLIVGLGNPGTEYENTLHNVGFMMVDQLAYEVNTTSFREKFNALMAKSRWQDEEFILLKPLTYMNRSGQAVLACLSFFKIPITELVVIYDDLDLSCGRVRCRNNGGHGGHNGMRSIIDHLGSRDFKRVRIGIDRPPGNMAPSSYVLSNWTKANLEKYQTIEKDVIEYLLGFISKSVFDNTSFQ